MGKLLLICPGRRLLGARFPYSLLPIAGYLLEKGKDKVEILDDQVEDYKKAKLEGVDVVAITSLTGPQIKKGIEIAKYVKEKDPNIKVIWGGVHATLVPDQTAKNPYVDVVCVGEGEKTMYDLMRAFENNTPLSKVRGIAFEKDGKVITTPPQDLIDLNELPLLPYELLKTDEYVELKRKPSIVSISSSRGCPHRCGFCYNNKMHNSRWRSMSVERTLQEIEHIKEKFNPEEMWYNDDCLAANKDRLKQICQGIIDRKFDIKWLFSSRYDYVAYYDSELLDLISKSGCKSVSFGGESGSPRVLKLINKGFTLDQMFTSIKRMKKHNVPSGVNFMCGFPTETPEEVHMTFKVIDKIVRLDPSIDIPNISVYSPFPGTPLYKLALEGGFKEPKTLEQWGDYRYNEISSLPWVKGRMKKLCQTISLLTRFHFTHEEYPGPGIFTGKPFHSLAHKFFWHSAKFRWKKKFFKMPLEWDLLDSALKIFDFGEK